jgi:hypothetical protein
MIDMFKVHWKDMCPIQRHENLASAFRHLMTQRQNINEANNYRKEFFNAVIKKADEVQISHL